MFDKVAEYARRHHPMTGYIEGEFIALDVDLPDRPFDSSVPVAVHHCTRDNSARTFRESEIHVTMNRDTSDPRLRANMLKMGFLRVPKSYGVAEVFRCRQSHSD